MINNKRAFTLVEMIGVITILSLLLLVAVPAITQTLKNNKNKKYDRYVANLKMAAETYITNNFNKYPELKSKDGTVYVFVKTLLDEGLINKTIDDPNTSSNNQPDTVVVTVNDDMSLNYDVRVSEKLTDKVFADLSSPECTKTGTGDNVNYNGCYYKGYNKENSSSQTNYVWYGGFLWRIVGLESSGNIKMVTEYNLTSLASTDIITWLNYFKNLLPNKDNTTLLTETDYTNSSDGSTSYLLNVQGISWLYDAAKESFVSVNSTTPMTANRTYSTTINVAGVRPSIAIDKSVKISSGIGTYENPYRIDGDDSLPKGSSITSIKAGEYINIPLKTSGNTKLRIVSNSDGRVKAVSNSIYTEIYFGGAQEGTNQRIYKVLTARDQNADSYYNYINNSYLDEREQTWYNGNVLGNGGEITAYNNSTNSEWTSNKTSIGLLYYGELFATYNRTYCSNNKTDLYGQECEINDNDLYGTYLSNVNSFSGGGSEHYSVMLTSFTSGISMHGTNYTEANTSLTGGVRPAIYLSTLLKIVDGNGTPDNPYILSY